MSNRYKHTKIGKRFDGKQVYRTTIYPIIYENPNDIFIISNETDKLDTLAFRFYKDPSLWWIIGKVNNLGKGLLDVPPGVQLRIPTNIDDILREFKSVNE